MCFAGRYPQLLDKSLQGSRICQSGSLIRNELLACQVYDTGLPIRNLVVQRGTSLVLPELPLGIYAVAKFLASYVISNQPIANMTFKTCSSVTYQ